MTKDPHDSDEMLGQSSQRDGDGRFDVHGDENRFDLSVPTGNLVNPDDDALRPEIEKSNRTQRSVSSSGSSYKSMGWKGIDDAEEEDEPPVSFGKKEKIPEDELDMTPMVDVTFLLLIFFMVTASFTLQKSIPQPPAASDEASLNVQQEEDAKDYVEVIIDQNNTYYVTSRGDEEREAPSETEMRTLVKDAVDTFSPERMVITAHVDATHARLITACDAGQASNLVIEVKTTDIEF
jgi:biopolymer transport protein ExbD